MDSKSLLKSEDMPAVGALYPRAFAERGYWWWKSQEITYALRPKIETQEALQKKYGENLDSMVVFQVRRTDKTQGCASFYGNFFPRFSKFEVLPLIYLYLKVEKVLSSVKQKHIHRKL